MDFFSETVSKSWHWYDIFILKSIVSKHPYITMTVVISTLIAYFTIWVQAMRAILCSSLFVVLIPFLTLISSMAPKQMKVYARPSLTRMRRSWVRTRHIPSGSGKDPVVVQLIQQLTPEEMTSNQLGSTIAEKDDEIKQLELKLASLKIDETKLKSIQTEKKKANKEEKKDLK